MFKRLCEANKGLTVQSLSQQTSLPITKTSVPGRTPSPGASCQAARSRWSCGGRKKTDTLWRGGVLRKLRVKRGTNSCLRVSAPPCCCSHLVYPDITLVAPRPLSFTAPVAQSVFYQDTAAGSFLGTVEVACLNTKVRTVQDVLPPFGIYCWIAFTQDTCENRWTVLQWAGEQ